MKKDKIPLGLIPITAEILARRKTHAGLDALFEGAGFLVNFDGQVSKPVKCEKWLRQANLNCDNPLEMFGYFIAEFMDGEISQSEDSPRKRGQIIDLLKENGLLYKRGGHIIKSGLVGPSVALANYFERGGDMGPIEVEFERALDWVESDPASAVTAACAILESACKKVLDLNSVCVKKQVLENLWKETAKCLKLDPSQVDKDLKPILQGLFSISHGIAALRTRHGSVHGRLDRGYRIRPRHARLAIFAAHTMTLFILETSEERRDNKSASESNANARAGIED